MSTRAGDGSVASDRKVRTILDLAMHQQALQLAQRPDISTWVLALYSSICPRPVSSWASVWSLTLAMQVYICERAPYMYATCQHTECRLACVCRTLRLHLECCMPYGPQLRVATHVVIIIIML